MFCDELKERNIKGRARLFYVPRKLVMENELQFNFIRSLFLDIADEVKAFHKLYSPVDLFFISEMLSCYSYAEWLSKYNPSAYLSYFKYIKKNGGYPPSNPFQYESPHQLQ